MLHHKPDPNTATPSHHGCTGPDIFGYYVGQLFGSVKADCLLLLISVMASGPGVGDQEMGFLFPAPVSRSEQRYYLRDRLGSL